MPTLAPSRKKLRVVAADFLNSLPLTVEMAEDELFNFEYVVPSEGARQMMEQESDIALLPVAAVAEIGGLEVVPGPCIGANGRVESVVIVSQVPLDSVERLFIDNASRTSVVLAKVFMDSVGKGSIPFIRMPGQEIPASVKGTDAGLLIADIAFRESKQFKYRHDLADAWKRLTGEPFVFAVWAAQPGVLTPELVERINRRFWDGIARKHQIIEEWAARHQMPKAEVADYLDERIQFNLNKSAWYGMQEFFRLASNMKLLPDARVEFATPQSPQNGINTFGKFVPEVVPYSRSYGVDRILARADSGRRISVHDAERLYLEADLTDIGEVANNIRSRMNPGGRVSYIIARNINYTNVCNVDCGFCGFYRSDDPKRKGHNEGYVLTREQLREKMNELADGDGVQALVQGGVNPNLPLEYYTNLLRWMKSEWPQIQQNSFSADEVLGLCPNKTPQEISAVLHALRDAGLDTFAGAGAEILVDRVRKRVSYKKSRSAVWLEVMRQVGIMGMKASVTMLYGMGETTRDKFAHMAKIRQLQDEVAPFMVFVTWPYQKGPDQKIKSFDQAGSTYLRVQGIARIFFDNIQHIMCSWVTQGPDIGQTALYYGADDFGSVMFEENVVSASGTTFKMDASSMEHCIGEAGFIPFRRKGDFSPWDPAEHQALKSQSIIAELTPGMI
ncbi:MAG: radical SAM protein [Chlorobi bacterium]|nr:radical SAM protein [Chlorobiota bacterium]MBX7217125.1 radical SAM protein [Candidatus Kapabacteria bacterium]